MSKTTNYQSNQDYLINYLHSLSRHSKKCQLALNELLNQDFGKGVPLVRIDQSLRDYIDTKRNHLKIKNRHRLEQFKNEINQKIVSSLSLISTTINYVSCDISSLR